MVRDAAMKKPELFALAGGTAAVFSTVAPDKESGNEDCAVLVPLDAESGVLGVADGAGGMRAGAQASGIAVETVARALREGTGLELRDALLNGIERANAEIAGLAIGASTTLAVVGIQGRTVRPYHVGDSMIVVVGNRGKVKLQTVSHSPVGYAVEAGLLGEREALHHEDRHLVSNMLGSADMRIEIGAELTLAPRDTLVIASDGLFDNLHVEEIIEIARKGPLSRAARTLATSAAARMQEPGVEGPSKPDDLTFIIYRPDR